MPTAIQNIGNQLVKLGNRLLGKKIMAIGRNVFNLSAPETYAPIGVENAIEDGFNKNIIVYSVTMKDAEKFGSIPRYLYAADKKEEKAKRTLAAEVKALRRDKYTNRGLEDLLNRPNKTQSQDAFFTLLRAYYKVCGEGFIWLNRGDLEGYRNEDGSFMDEVIDKLPVLEMYVLPSNLMGIIPDPDDIWSVLGYILQAGQEVVIRKGDVIHWKSTTLKFDVASREHLRGFTALTPGALTLEESNSVTRASMRSAQNDGAKAVMFDKSMKAMTPTQQSELKKVIDIKINNKDVSNAVATVQGDWGLLDLSQTAKDQMHIEKKLMLWKEMCFLLKVPVELFDPQTTFANKEMAMVAWVTNDIIPACKQLDGELNRMLLKAFGLEKAAFIGTDYSELQEIQKAMADTAKTMKEVGWFTPNEIREVMAYEKRPEKEMNEPWPSSGNSPLSQSLIEEDAMNFEAQRLENGYNGTGNGKVPQNGAGAQMQD